MLLSPNSLALTYVMAAFTPPSLCVLVNRAFGVAQHPDCFLVHEGQKLHQNHAAPAPLGVDPIESIEQARPRQASLRAAARISGRVDQETQSPLLRVARLNVHVAGGLRCEALHQI